MDFKSIVEKDVTKIKTTALVVFHFQEEPLEPYLTEIDQRLGNAISKLTEKKVFSGSEGEVNIIPTLGKLDTDNVILVGLGKKKEFNHDTMRRAGAYSVQNVRKLKINKYAIFIPENIELIEEICARALVEGTIMGNYQFTEYKSEKKGEVEVEEVTLVWEKNINTTAVNRGIEIGKTIANAVNYVRNLGNHPANVMTPTKLAEEAMKLGKQYGLKVKVLDLDEALKMGMNTFYAVAKGSEEPAKFIIMEYNMDKNNLPLYAVVGKGITFDSGGLSLKPSNYMQGMKYDMCGGAATLGIMKAAAELKLPIRLVGVVPATENMPSGSATKVGDIVKSYSGVTVEILNTDAEGRLILADGLGYVSKNYKPKAIIDLATLTGACVVALGNVVSGLFTKDDTLAEKLTKAGYDSWDRVWRLPLWQEYYDLLKSDFADVKNIGGRYAGAITAAAFLSKFIVGDIPWAHLDIAGTAFVDNAKAYTPKGATGAGVRVVVQFLLNETKQN